MQSSSRLVFLLFITLLACPKVLSSEQITIVGNLLPPFSLEENGELSGFSVELIGYVLKQHYANDVIIVKYPVSFARVYSQTLNGPKTIAVNFARNEVREAKFHWVGPYYKFDMAIIGLQKDPNEYHEITELKQEKILVVRDTMVGDILSSIEIPKSNIVTIPDPLNGLKMLMAGRAPLMSHIPDVLRFMIETELDLSPDTLEVKHHLKEGEFYFALSKDFSQYEVEKIQQSLDDAIQKGKLDELYKKYGLPDRN